METGIELIAKERQEQIEKHGRTISYDINTNSNMELSTVALYLCIPDLDSEDFDLEDFCPFGWDINIFTHMCSKPYKERLIIAGALIAAEIDRLQNIFNIIQSDTNEKIL